MSHTPAPQRSTATAPEHHPAHLSVAPNQATATNPGDPRAAYTAGLRLLADILDANPELPLPYATIGLCTGGTDAADVLATFARVVPGTVTKRASDDGQIFYVEGHIAGLPVKAFTSRHNVCERVVTGTRQATRLVPDPAALAAVPVVAVTETIEDIEWVCGSLLATDRVPAGVSA